MIVSTDIEGVRMAFLRLFEDSLRAADTERILSNLADTDDISQIERALPPNDLSPGYRQWCEYILWLESMISANVTFSLDADEAEGIRILSAARQQFRNDHPQCPSCGTMQSSRTSRRCRSCAREMN